jgi:long-chain acyl-CoA synthetase
MNTQQVDLGAESSEASLSVREQLKDKHILITGVTGFVGKILLTMIAAYAPEVRRVSVLIRSNKHHPDARSRFDKEVWTSEPFKAVKDLVDQERGSGQFKQWVDEKVNPVTGDITCTQLGMGGDVYQELTTGDPLELILHCAGNVSFDPPLDEALEVNTLGAAHKVELARDAGCPLVHMSTCFVAGERDGAVYEESDIIGYNPKGRPFDPSREVSDAQALIKRWRQDAHDQANDELFYQRARDVLIARDLNPDGEVLLAEEIEKQRDKWLREQLRTAGLDRSKRWGWTNTYTYSKSLGEQLTALHAADANVPLCIVRPAIVESALRFPFTGWNEGVNTCAPIVYLFWKGERFSPSNPDNILDVVPVDWVCQGTLLAAAELLEGQAPLVYQLSTGGENPLHMRRAVELTNLAWRARYDQDFGPLKRHLMRNLDTINVTPEQYKRYGAPAVQRVARGVSGLLNALPSPARKLLKPVSNGFKALDKGAQTADLIFTLFAPFILDNNPVFKSNHVLAAANRLDDEEFGYFGYPVTDLDWRHYWIDVHMAGLQRWSFGELDDKLNRKRLVPQERDLVALFHRVCERYEYQRALHYFSSEGCEVTYTYGDLWRAALSVAGGLRTAGVQDHERIILVGPNEPVWPMIYFGALIADLTIVPVDEDMNADEVARIARASEARFIVHHETWEIREDDGLDQWSKLTWGEVLCGDPIAERDVALKDRQNQLASLLFTSGTTGEPKGVMLTHENFCSLLSSLHGVFKVSHRDHFLSVLPLFHTFEFSAGLLMPLSTGAQITYLSDREGPTLRKAMKDVRPTGIIGIPALWDVLEKRIQSQVKDRGQAASMLFKASTALNRQAKRAGLNLGPLFFNEVHSNLGGRIRYLISGGAALKHDVLDVFEGLGFELLEGYGLTEAAPVLSVRRPGSKHGQGSVGKPLPGVEIRIQDPNEEGIGEVIARGGNVMRGYLDRPEDTAHVLRDGWLYTGDLGYLDEHGQVVLTGRSKEMIVTSSGKNVYPDELEPIFAAHDMIDEISVVGIPDPQGDERVAALIVLVDEAPEGARAEVKSHINQVNAKRPDHQRLRTYRFWPEALPRTATRKVKRAQVRQELIHLLEVSRETRRVNTAVRQQESQSNHESASGLGIEGSSSGQTSTESASTRWLRSALSALTEVPPNELHTQTHLISDLGLSSLQRVELRMMIEDRREAPLDGILYTRAETLGSLAELIDQVRDLTADDQRDDEAERKPFWQRLPSPLAALGRQAVDVGRGLTYRTLYQVKVTGREHIPFNHQAIIISNHTSHLDIGLIKEALSSYGNDVCVLAAQDYFFDDEYKEAILSQFTRLLPIDRTTTLERSLKPAEDAIAQGYSVLIYPEGTRSTDGELQDFKLGVGYLQRRTNLPVLPLYLKGTHRALPKGANLPKVGRTLSARIGPLIDSDTFAQRCADRRRHDQYQEATAVCLEAIESLRDGDVYPWDKRTDEINTGPSSAERLMIELCDRYQADAFNQPITWYFSLGDKAEDKWTLSVHKEGAVYVPGKPQGGKADCVLKTNVAIFTRMVRESYVPSMTEFMEGKVKTNNPNHLQTLQVVFDL